LKLSNLTKRKFIESYPGNGRQILTPKGYVSIIEVHKTIPYRKFRIELKNGLFLEGAYNHVVIDKNNIEYYIKDSLNIELQTEIGISKVIKVQDLEIEENMYDITIDSEDELYFSNGILSHNSGKTITASINLAHYFVFKRDMNIGIVSNRGSQAREFLNNAKNILVELPIWMQVGIETWNKTYIEGENGMRMLTDVPSSDAFMGFTISILIVDECAKISSSVWDAFADSIFPSQSALAWKKNIIISTMRGMNHFYDIVQGARNGTNGFTLFEVDWHDVPRFDSKGNQLSNEVFQQQIIDKHGIIYFNQNYANEAIGSSNTLISSPKLKSLHSQEIQEIRDGKLKIYIYPEKNHKYIMTIDAAKDGTDAFAVQIIDITDFNFLQSACAQLQIDYLLMPEFINEWCEYYNNPYLIIENNEGAGQSIADQMYNDYEYENLHFDKDIGRNKRKKYPGFRTTSKSRRQILQTLKLFIENNKLTINDKSTINELYRFILIKNKYQADDGSKDDMVMSLALVFVPFINVKNFEDMKKLIQNLYVQETLEENEKTSFTESLTIGCFDTIDDTNFDTQYKPKVYLTIEEAFDDQNGFN
jgi:hypothetical protein